MAQRTRAKETDASLKGYFRRRPDIGFGKAILGVVLQPLNPFEPEKRRRPKRWFIGTAILVITLAVWFSIFNFAR